MSPVIPVSQQSGKVDKCHSIQLIDGNGDFNVAGMEYFGKEVGMNKWGVSYSVISIMGPQSGGKSTLLNNLFHTNFREMDTSEGRVQTTKGIWMAKCAGIEPCTLVMDLEGSDGGERGEDGTAFEKKTALFALYISDITLINMWCHDIGREYGASKPLLKTVFQVAMRLFSDFGSRKRTLMFVIRDKTKTPPKTLESQLRSFIQKIWDSVPKTEVNKEIPLSEFFNVEVVFLSNYEEKEKEFKEQVASLRQRFFHSIESGGLAGDRRGVVSASAFSFDAEKIWEKIKENRDLNLPAHKVMVATVCCEEIAKEKFNCFAEDKDWCRLNANVQFYPIPGCGKTLIALIRNYLSEYNAETSYYDEGIRSERRDVLTRNLLQLVQPAWQFMLGHLRFGALEKFKVAFESILNGGQEFSMALKACFESFVDLFDKECEDAGIELTHCDTCDARQKLKEDMCAHVVRVVSERGARFAAANNGHMVPANNGHMGRGNNGRNNTLGSFLSLLSGGAVLASNVLGFIG